LNDYPTPKPPLDPHLIQQKRKKKKGEQQAQNKDYPTKIKDMVAHYRTHARLKKTVYKIPCIPDKPTLLRYPSLTFAILIHFVYCLRFVLP